MNASKCVSVLVFCVIHSVLLTRSWETEDHAKDCELVLLQVVFRHGERNPVKAYPNDPYKNESYWPEGFGQLTKMGKLQQYKLGQFIRKRYDGFLSEEYSPYELLIQSSNVDRAIMSALANLAGLYPVGDHDRWNVNLDWQPIPVHNKPEDIDRTIGQKARCPRFDLMYQDFLLNSEVMKKVNEENAELYQILTNYTGSNITNVKEVEYLVDTLFIEKSRNLTLPDWTSEMFPKHEKKLRELQGLSFKAITYTDEFQRIKAGPLIGELRQNMEAKMNATMDFRLKFFMYSGHDTTLTSILNTLGLYDNIPPTYSSMIMLELHRNLTSNQYFIELIYRNSTFDELHKLHIPGCGEPCFLADFISLTSSKIPENWEKECELPSSESDVVGIVVGAMLLFVLIGMSICCGLILRSYIRGKRKDPQPPKYPYLHLQMDEGEDEMT